MAGSLCLPAADLPVTAKPQIGGFPIRVGRALDGHPRGTPPVRIPLM